MNLLITLMANLRQHIAQHRANRACQDDSIYFTYTHPEDDLYPMTLKRGNVTVEGDGTTEYVDATAIINQDRSITITHEHNIIGWHAADTYYNITSN